MNTDTGPTTRITAPAQVFGALGDETRLRIVNLLLHAGTRVCVCEIVGALELPQYRISRQLAILKRADIVSAKKKGTWAYYGLNPENTLFEALVPGLRQILTGEPFTSDRTRLDRRLDLRESGRCVVGLVETFQTE